MCDHPPPRSPRVSWPLSWKELTDEISSALDDTLRSETTQAPSVAQIPVIEAPESSLLAVDQPDGPSLASTLKLPESSSQFLSPIPPADKPQHIFSLSDLYDGSGGGLETLGPDIALADISPLVVTVDPPEDS